jgi:hypothetical protein
LNEEILGYLLSVIDMNRLKAKVLTVPDIDNLEKVETDLKDRLQVYYTAQYFVDKTTEAYQNYQQLHFRYLNGPPSEYHIRGYDLAKYIMTVADDDAYSPHLAQRLRMYNRIDGLHAGIEFGANQDNQAVHILQMTPQGRKIWK